MAPHTSQNIPGIVLTGRELLAYVGVFFGLLTLPFVHSQPLWQDHLHVS